MPVNRNRSITRVLFFSMALVVVLTGLSIGAVWVLDAYGPQGGLIGTILKSLLVLAGFLCITVWIVRSVGRGIEKSIDALAAAFRSDEGQPQQVDGRGFFFREFASLAQAAGEMMDRRGRSEETLKNSEAALSSLFSAAPIGIVLIADGVIQQVNENLCQMLGYARRELVKERADVLYVDQAEAGRVSREVDDMLRRQGTGTLETQWKCRDGRAMDVSLSYAAVEDSRDNLITFTALDVSGQKQVEQERGRIETMLRQAQKMEAIGTLAGGIAHDFNNILSPILIQTEMALMDLPPESPIRNNLEDVLEAGNRARELVKQILAFSRQAEEELQPVRVSSIVKESLKLLRATLPTTIAIEQSIEAESGLVLADSTQIHQVLMNLFTNAYQAMQDKGGVLRVELDRFDVDASAPAEVPGLTTGPYLRLAVSDNGIGMDSRTLERIFDPYFTLREKGQGTGMGLAVVHGIVKGYGGTVKVTSSPGEGACFEVFLPLVVPERAVRAGEVDALPGGNERILLVDDERAIIVAIQQMLERLGYRVTAMTSSVEAYQDFCVRPDDYDLVITDQTMPDMTGEALSRKLMALRPSVPIILCTGFSHVIDEEGARSLGIRKLIMKPVVMREMALAIREALDKK